LSTFDGGGDELLVSNRQYFTVSKGISFVFKAFMRFAEVVAARKTIVLAVKTTQWRAETIPAAVEEVPAAFAITQWTAKTTRAAAEIISSVIAKVVAEFQTSQRIVRTISCAAQTIPPAVTVTS
jgi:hypothetical protein